MTAKPDVSGIAGQAWLSNEPFKMLVDSVNDYAIFMLDPNGFVRTWNPGAANLKLYCANEIIGKHFSIFYPEKDVLAGKCERELVVAAASGRFEDEDWRVRKNGERFWANVVISAIRSPDGELHGFAKVTRDLTERRRAEEQLRQSELRLRLLIENIRDYAIFMLDPQGLVTTWNPGAQHISQYPADEIIGQHFSRFYTPEAQQSQHPDYELQVAAAIGRYEEEGWRVRRDGSLFWANVIISAIRDKTGGLLGFAKITRDLTERKEAEKEAAARLSAEAASKAKDEFLAVLGHELRNPLAPTLTALQLMKLRGEVKSSKELEIIERQLKHLVRLVDDLLDLSTVARRKFVLKKERLGLCSLIARSVEMVAPLIEERRHDLVIDVTPDEIYVEGDVVRMAQVFANILNNAAKYTDPGGRIIVSVRPDGDEAVVRVEDNGIGIAPNLLPTIFEAFVQAPQPVARSVGGMGIGLSLVRSFVELHGGKVTASSAGLRKGTVLTVRLPRLADARMPPSPVATENRQRSLPHPASRKLLLVDDNEDALTSAAEVLRLSGHDVRTARDGMEALRVVEAFRPDAALLDIGLPGMDGFELAKELRSKLGGDPPLRLVALTGYGQDSDRMKTHAAGFDAHLVKPVDLPSLLGALTDAR